MTPPGLRERAKQARRDALIDAAQRLTTEQPLDAVTVEAICSEAGVSTRTFFNYFDSKDDAVLGFRRGTVDGAAAEAFATGGPVGRLTEDLAALVTALVDRPEVEHRRMACALELARREPRLLARQLLAFEAHHQEIAELVGRRLGVPARSPRAELLTLLVVSLVRAAVVRWEAGGQHGTPGDVVPEVLADLRDLVRDD